ncbi:DUF4386 domain-containing protein [Sphingomonas naphthae]|uniref:DUF4386 domain-containing protein n=1 Tax=Sphingomonas naphthae TaxID=1813468 RepID=A0ABY7TN59_9SPHN|nr:DUF4386 domain-containing protein [Sphingomonas naphthae]WCT73840.1 DUF4386 domain-containing protein [Sphingomonas naphthae]
MQTSPAQARLAGAFYLGTIVAGLFAELAVRARFRAAGDLLAAIARQPLLYRAGEVADLVMLCCYIVVTGLLYRLFVPAGRTVSLIAAGFSLVGIAVLAVAGLLHLAPLALAADPAALDVNAVARLTLDLHGDLYGISLVFFGVYCTLIGWLAFRSALLPRAAGVLMALGGLTHVITKALWLLAPAVAVPRPILMLPLLGEAVLALWLLVFAIRRR